MVIYTLQDNSYQVKDIIASPQGFSNEEFGGGVAVSDDGNYIFIGAPGHSNQRGCIYVYNYKQDFSSEQYDFLTQITPDQAVNGLRFGENIKADTKGTKLIVSCPRNPLAYSGIISISLYEKKLSVWFRFTNPPLESMNAKNSVYIVLTVSPPILSDFPFRFNV